MDDNTGKTPGTSATMESTTMSSISQKAMAGSIPTPNGRTEVATTAKPTHMRDGVRTKIKRARSRVLVLIACLAYIVTVFTVLSIGTHQLFSYLTPRLHTAQVELRALGNLKYREHMLYSRLDKLLSTQLSGRFGETYEECLVRSLDKANDQFFGLGFQYPEIRQPTIEWAVDNCGRLLYTPQLVTTTPQQVVLTRWALGKYRARVLTEKACNLVTSVWSRWLGKVRSHLLALDDETIDHKPDIEDNVHNITSVRPPAKMPFGFDLTCDVSSLCRPVYTQFADMAAVSNDDINKSIQKVQELSAFCNKLNAFRYFMTLLALFFVAIEVLGLTAYSIMGIYMFKTAQPQQSRRLKASAAVKMYMRHLTGEEKYVTVSIAVQLLAMVAYLVVMRLPSPGGKVDMVSGVFMSMIGGTMLVNFFVPAAQLENAFNISGTIKDLYMIATSHKQKHFDQSVPSKVCNDTRRPDENATAGLSQQKVSTSSDSTATTSSKTPISPKAPPRPQQVSLATTVQEDVHAELNALRQSREHQSYAESASELDSDEEGFVDLAGGITPTTTETESGWAVVDA